MDQHYLGGAPIRRYANPQELNQGQFIADQQLYAALGYLPPQRAQQLSYLPVPAPQQQVLPPEMMYDGGMYAQQQGAVGWGGQAIQQDSAAYRVPWFGRSRFKQARQRTNNRDDMRPRTERESFMSRPTPSLASVGRDPADAMSVEDLVSLIQKVPKRDALPERVYKAFYHLDSRAVALLFKDLSRVGFDKRAEELFDWLRGLPDDNPLRTLCDVYTYTAMVSLCIYQQNVDRAMELVEDMRMRGIERNVHTYTALMNVCIKCGKLTTALEIYNTMKSVHCTPNVVTYNTLIDVYGKLGQWDRAVKVIDMMKHEGVEPVLRTYNTLVIACNMCNQPREALAVYHKMLSDGFTPNSTTFNALISAYGKTGQLDKALDVYQEMVRQNMDRSVITYSSLISACEKAGKWETALQIFNEMQHEGCSPNTVTFNSLITACAQGGQWQKASEMFERMGSMSCTPDVVTYTALISALERGGQWQAALAAFQRMTAQGCKPDAIVYNAIIDTLWETGLIWAQAQALTLFRQALSNGLFRQEPIVAKPVGRVELNLHAMTAGVAMLSLYIWLTDLQRLVAARGEAALPAALAVVTDVGKGSSSEQGNCIVKEAVAAMMSFWETPFRPVQDGSYSAVLEASGSAVASWVATDSFRAELASLFPLSDAAAARDDAAGGYVVREQTVVDECAKSFKLVEHFEATHGLVLQNMGSAYVAQRPALISRLLDLRSQLGLKDEVVHDAVLLMDRTASSAAQLGEDVWPLVAVASLMIAAKAAAAAAAPGSTPGGGAAAGGAVGGADGSGGAYPSPADLERLTDYPATSVAKMEWNIRGLLADDTAAISTMRCLKIYLERLGYRFLDKQGIYGLAGFSIMLAVESLYDISLLNCRPSVVAAALLYAERRLRGAVPFWPSMMAKLTGYEDLATPELNVAVRVAQKICRKAVYAQMYRAQLVCLATDSSGSGAAPATVQQQQQQQQQGMAAVARPPADVGGLVMGMAALSTGDAAAAPPARGVGGLSGVAIAAPGAGRPGVASTSSAAPGGGAVAYGMIPPGNTWAVNAAQQRPAVKHTSSSSVGSFKSADATDA